MPKVIYTPSKGLYQTSGSGIEISDVSILPASTSLAPGGPVYKIILTDVGVGYYATGYVGTISIARADGTVDDISIVNGPGGDINSSSWSNLPTASGFIAQAIAAINSNEEFAYIRSQTSVANDTITLYSLKAGLSGADLSVSGVAIEANSTVETLSQGVSGEILGENNLAIEVASPGDIDGTTLRNSSGALLSFASDALNGVSLANGSAVGQKVSVMNLSTNRSITVTGLFFDCTGNSSETKLNLHASDIQQLIWNGSAWAEARSSGTPSFG